MPDGPPMKTSKTDLLERIAIALERLAPPPPPNPDFAAAEAFIWQTDPDAFQPVARYAAVVPVGDLFANDCNFNIRRYADNAPPPEAHDVRAHLRGGVPRAEVFALGDMFKAVGLRAASMFTHQPGPEVLMEIPPVFPPPPDWDSVHAPLAKRPRAWAARSSAA